MSNSNSSIPLIEYVAANVPPDISFPFLMTGYICSFEHSFTNYDIATELKIPSHLRI